MNDRNNIGNTFNGGFTTRNTGSTHVTVDSNPGTMGTHVTTSIPGLKQGVGIDVHTPIGPNGAVGPSDFGINKG